MIVEDMPLSIFRGTTIKRSTRIVDIMILAHRWGTPDHHLSSTF
jgi:hypothetical protein